PPREALDVLLEDRVGQVLGQLLLGELAVVLILDEKPKDAAKILLVFEQARNVGNANRKTVDQTLADRQSSSFQLLREQLLRIAAPTAAPAAGPAAILIARLVGVVALRERGGQQRRQLGLDGA